MNIVSRWRVAHINELENKSHITVIVEISLDKPRPAHLVGLRHLCVAVSGKVHKVDVFETVKIYRCRFSGDCGDPRKIFSVEHLIYQRGFSHV